MRAKGASSYFSVLGLADLQSVFPHWSHFPISPLYPVNALTPQIYHPNVDLEGNVCLNILREDWKPVLNLNSITVGLQFLFLEPNADDPLNKEAAEELRKDRSKFARDVKKSLNGGSVGGQDYDSVAVAWHDPYHKGLRHFCLIFRFLLSRLLFVISALLEWSRKMSIFRKSFLWSYQCTAWYP